jgi:hypothetical protein
MKNFLVLFLVFSYSVAFTQDIIEFKSGKLINAKVIEVSEKYVSYRLKSSDGDGPVYKISIEKINKVQFENGVIDDFEDLITEHADLNRAHLLEFNAIDLSFERINLNYEFFPTEKRDFSVYVPVRWSFNPSFSHWNARPVIEAGLGSNLYIARKNKLNWSVGLESNYNFTKAYVTQEFEGFWQEVLVRRHWMGFYANSHIKFNFKPRLGINVGFAAGWKYDLSSSQSISQGKADVGVFYRF